MTARLALFATLIAGPAGAGCFDAEGMPARATYDGGIVLDYLSRDAEVLTYRASTMTTRMQSGLWPLDHRSDGYSLVYTWADPLPDLDAVIAAGGTARATGTRTQQGQTPVPVVAEVTVQGTETVVWEDCSYQAIRFTKTMQVKGTPESSAVLVYAPQAMITFRTEATDPSGGQARVFVLTALE